MQNKRAQAYQDAKSEDIEVDLIYYFEEWATYGSKATRTT